MTGLDGVTFLDHTADVGLEVAAPSLEALFRRAAAGMMALVRGEDEESGGAPEPAGRAGAAPGAGHQLALKAGDAEGLLVAWLRELLFLHEAEGVDYAGASFHRLTGRELEARVETEPARPAVREIKGVTYHGLSVGRTEEGWKARVIFDV